MFWTNKLSQFNTSARKSLELKQTFQLRWNLRLRQHSAAWSLKKSSWAFLSISITLLTFQSHLKAHNLKKERLSSKWGRLTTGSHSKTLFKIGSSLRFYPTTGTSLVSAITTTAFSLFSTTLGPRSTSLDANMTSMTSSCSQKGVLLVKC